ncbi:hypothetical protein C8Q75DRAFT_805621 [Abortiporus biennis]|nr:hypothetical protein C8Q75DRAFT_805621 [Abortiporus biennis]
MAQSPTQLPKLDNTLGAVFIGVIAASILFGVACVQAFTYFMHNMKKDSMFLRSMVAFLWILDFVDLIFIAHFVYFYAITNYSNPAGLLDYPWSGPSFNIATNLNDVLVRGILIYRIWKVSNSRYVAVGLWIANLTVSAFSLASALRVEIVHDLAKLNSVSWLFYVVYAGIAILDTVIAVALCVILWKKKTGFRRTDTQINMLMRYSIHTGALTSVASIGVLITYAAMPHNYVYIGIYVALPKLYLNAILAMLNGRNAVRAEAGDPSFTSVDLSKINVSSSVISSIRQDAGNHSTRINDATVVILREVEEGQSKVDPFHGTIKN